MCHLRRGPYWDKFTGEKGDAIAIGGMMFELGELTTLPLIFDEKLWNGTVDHVTVHADERVVLRFKDGKEIETRL